MKQTILIAVAAVILVAVAGLYFLAFGNVNVPQPQPSSLTSTVSVSTIAPPAQAFGSVLISDQFNNRVIEVNTTTNGIVWSYGSNDPSLCNPGNGSVIGPNWAERLSNGFTLIAGTGLPANLSPTLPNGCVDNRVMVVNAAGNIVWQYGQAGVTGNGTDELNVPVSAIQLPNGDFLITDQGNNRVIEVNQSKQVVWSYNGLNNPNSAELLGNGDILIADQNNNRAIEVTRAGSIVWSYNASLQTVAFASRLSNGSTLLVDSGHSRVLAVSPANTLSFEYYTNSSAGSNAHPLPTNAAKLKNGDIIIADQFNDRVMIVNPLTDQIAWQYGQTNVPGNNPSQLNAPYTAFVVGDYTGQTVPPG